MGQTGENLAGAAALRAAAAASVTGKVLGHRTDITQPVNPVRASQAHCVEPASRAMRDLCWAALLLALLCGMASLSGCASAAGKLLPEQGGRLLQ